MILDSIKNAGTYKSLSPLIAKSLEALERLDFSDIPDGKYEIDGDKIFYMVQRYTTKPFETALPEAHEKYIDVQFVVSGSEVIGYCPIDGLEVQTPYNAEKDVVFFNQPTTITKS